MQNGPFHDEAFPEEVVLHISEYLPLASQLSLSGTCQKMNRIIKDKFIWKEKLTELAPFCPWAKDILPTQENVLHALNDIHQRLMREVQFFEQSLPQLAGLAAGNAQVWLSFKKDIQDIKGMLATLNKENYLTVFNNVHALLNTFNQRIIELQLQRVAPHPQHLKLEYISRLPEIVLEKQAALFSSIRILELKNNCLATLPVNISICANLESLNLYDNPICYVPSALEKLSELKYLYFSNGNLSKLPHAIYALKNLQWLSFDNMRLKFIDEKIERLENLSWVYLRNNRIAFIPVGFCKLRKLKFIMLDDNDICPLQPPEVLRFLNAHEIPVKVANRRKQLSSSAEVDQLVTNMTMLTLAPQVAGRRLVRYQEHHIPCGLKRTFSFF